MRLISWLSGIVVATALSGAALADNLDCKNPQTQSDMTACEQQRQSDADAALNAQYKRTRAAAVEVDKNLDENLRGAEKALVKAQRAWVDFRDGQCEAAGFGMRGGSGEPMLVAGCTADLTDKRTAELKELADTFSGN
jgi:uncharacterized protein YecT (DUF1311 family)